MRLRREKSKSATLTTCPRCSQIIDAGVTECPMCQLDLRENIGGDEAPGTEDQRRFTREDPGPARES